MEIARDTLDRLRIENGEHPEILARYNRLGGSLGAIAPDSIQPDSTEALVVEPAELVDGVVLMPELPISEVDDESSEMLATEFEITVSDEPEDSEGEQVGAMLEESKDSPREGKPFFIQKESGPLYPDLVVQLNTSELRGFDAFEGLRPAVKPTPVQASVGTGDLIESLVSSIDLSFDAIHRPEPERGTEISQSLADVLSADEGTSQPLIDDSQAHESTSQSMADTRPAHESNPIDNRQIEVSQSNTVDKVGSVIASMEKRIAGEELQEIFDELKEQTGDLTPLLDFETHYSLGLAYKDMDLLDEAISEFQMAFRTAGIADLEGDCIHCCNMLGVCFKRKQMLKVAVMWFDRGLKIANRTEDEYQALRFEIGLCQEELGDTDKAIETFTEVYGIDVNYRKVGDKIKQLRATKT